MKKKGLWRVFSNLILILCAIIMINLLMGFGDSKSILKSYDNIKPDSSSGLQKNLQFIEGYTRLTGDASLALNMGYDSSVINSWNNSANGEPGGNPNPIEVPIEVGELTNLIKTLQDGNPGKATNCNKVFRILYPTTSETYTSLKHFNNYTEQKIKTLNAGNMSALEVEVWQFANLNFDSTDFTKVSKKIKVNMCTTLHPIIKQIFAEIYADPSKPVIMSVGGHSVRGMNNGNANSSTITSTHSYGGTIDINFTVGGKNVSWNWNTNNGSAERPYPRSEASWNNLKENQYKYLCIYENSVIVKTFEKYGLYWGGNWSKEYCDPMHFSIFDH